MSVISSVGTWHFRVLTQLLINTLKKRSQRLVTLETFDQSNEETWHSKSVFSKREKKYFFHCFFFKSIFSNICIFQRSIWCIFWRCTSYLHKLYFWKVLSETVFYKTVFFKCIFGSVPGANFFKSKLPHLPSFCELVSLFHVHPR